MIGIAAFAVASWLVTQPASPRSTASIEQNTATARSDSRSQQGDGAAPAFPDSDILESRLEIFTFATNSREVIYTTPGRLEAPNWSPDGQSFIVNGGGRLWRIPRHGGTPTLIDTGGLARLNNDHGFSPDGKWMAISHAPEGESLVYVMPADGGEPSLVTALGPSYWHGWSPDGGTLAYVGERNGEFDVYTVPADARNTRDERRLTTAPGLDDGPDYAPDGTIYFNSARTGVMRIWKMNPDGSNQQQVTIDGQYADWFPHPSPDGRFLVFLSYDSSVDGHPPNKNVVLRLMPLPDGPPRVIVSLFGGQGTLNVPSWSPDSQAFAFMSYRLRKGS